MMVTNLAVVVAEVETAIREEADARIAAVRLYAKHLYGGGDPTVISGYAVPEGLVKASPYCKELADAWREDQGWKPNPASPREANRWNALDALLDREWISAAELKSEYLGRSQVEAALQPWRLEAAGYKLLKDTVDGKVAYRLVAA
jgi:hypothetical protein